MFWSKKQVVKIDRTIGSDGYRECDRPVLQWFQAKYEATHIDAVRCALYAARDPQFVVTKQSLVRFIQQQDWAEAGGSYE